jgi:hypothetical protein
LAEAAASFHPPMEYMTPDSQDNQDNDNNTHPTYHTTWYSEYCNFIPFLDFSSLPRYDPVSLQQIPISTDTSMIREGVKWTIIINALDAGFEKVNKKDKMDISNTVCTTIHIWVDILGVSVVILQSRDGEKAFTWHRKKGH